MTSHDTYSDGTKGHADGRRALLSAAGLAAGYNGHPVVRNIDLHVCSGEVVALLGPNGAGKTTTLSALAGVSAPLAGTVSFGHLATKTPLFKKARAGLAYVTEKRSVFMQLSVAQNLRVGRCDVDYALALFPELASMQDRLAGQLSGGEQQMLSLARALARRPRVLLADELSLGLAPLIVARLLTAVREVSTSDGVAVLIVEQHASQALQVADRAYVMRRGEIVLEGTAAEVDSRLEAAYLGADDSV